MRVSCKKQFAGVQIIKYIPTFEELLIRMLNTCSLHDAPVRCLRQFEDVLNQGKLKLDWNEDGKGEPFNNNGPETETIQIA